MVLPHTKKTSVPHHAMPQIPLSEVIKGTPCLGSDELVYEKRL